MTPFRKGVGSLYHALSHASATGLNYDVNLAIVLFLIPDTDTSRWHEQ